jgi:hypothetical protein
MGHHAAAGAEDDHEKWERAAAMQARLQEKLGMMLGGGAGVAAATSSPHQSGEDGEMHSKLQAMLDPTKNPPSDGPTAHASSCDMGAIHWS